MTRIPFGFCSDTAVGKRMNASHQQAGIFQKVGDCFYRDSSNGNYYAKVRHEGKLIRRSLKTGPRYPEE